MYGVIDIGTTGIKLSVYDEELRKIHYEKHILGFEQLESGFIEQDSRRLAEVVRGLSKKARELGVKKLGICTYRASVLAWRKDGSPLTNVITWMDGRGIEVISKLSMIARALKKLSGSLNTILSPDSPAVLLKWIYERMGIEKDVEDGKAFAWTLDSFLIYNLSGKFLSDSTNATLTGLIHPKDLSKIDIVFDLLKLPGVTPDVVENVADLGRFEGMDLVVSIADQQSAAVGMGVLERGKVESVHGTGSFIEAATSEFTMPKGGLIPLIILNLGGRRVYGLEGFIRSTGSTVDWLKEVGLFSSYDEMEELARMGRRKAILVPSLGGLRVPRADKLRGIITGLDLSTRRADIVSGIAWGISIHLAIIIERMRSHLGSLREPLLSAGGYSRSDSFLRRLSDLSGMRVARVKDTEASSFGVAKLLAYSDGKLSYEDLHETPEVDASFEPGMSEDERNFLIKEYSKLLEVITSCERNPFMRGSF
ncbi:FGGY family carbohydrate kinase [Candidatus Korarchaeum cryptofilum]|jgi:glycerol kinase|uniref:FGGY family carbohydrate kinase n=1 Tax=Candidatus Korarchaeum cryptofilum TaxID=498846 RepID=UPI001EFF0C79|nr:FGGY family carbohydrate kinase [Candidatus Korarchaeum cryptofilum]